MLNKKEDTVVPKFDIPMDASFFSTLFGNTLLVNDTQQEVDTKTALHNSRLIAIYFSAHWCPPCRKFTPMLCELYQHLKDEVLPTHGLEVVFVSSDRDPSSFRHYSGSMPWLSLPYENRAAQQSISAR
jgi:nucleoredoxin